jgi:hypothetical protein
MKTKKQYHLFLPDGTYIGAMEEETLCKFIGKGIKAIIANMKRNCATAGIFVAENINGFTKKKSYVQEEDDFIINY